MPDGGLGGAVGGIIGGVASIFTSAKANKELKRLMGEDPQYKANPLAAQRLGYAQTLLNARMPGAAAMERNIYGAEADAVSNMQRGATDSGQLLAAAGRTHEQTNSAFENLGQMENQDFQRRYNNLSGAQDAQIAEDDKVYQDNVRRFQDKVQIKGMMQQNRQAVVDNLSGALGSAFSFGLGGGLKGMFGGDGGGDTMGAGHTASRLNYIPLGQR